MQRFSWLRRALFIFGWVGYQTTLGAADSRAELATPPASAAGEDTSSARNNGVERVIVISDEGVPSAYGAPPEFSRSRAANLTNAYVLPPWTVYAGFIYEGDALRFNRPEHFFTQEIELGLPHRFGVAIENNIETYRGRTQERTFSLEARYALADWGKIPLNPTLFVEYKKGIGDILRDEGAPERMEKGEAFAMSRQTSAHIPDAIEMRLLLSQDFSHKVEWALNLFFEQEIEADRGREWGFAQSLLVPVFLSHERLKLGVEMQYSQFTDKDTRSDPTQRFVIGPTVAWKPTRNTRLDVSPLFGATFDAPRVQAFAVFSVLLGPPGAAEQEGAEAPASTRNR
ncbi:MAG: hypothetical protein JO295_01495 [Verrucomicrobia bacterium]|nr:hypothetical protein [Verrucomicrobiota bacterium]